MIKVRLSCKIYVVYIEAFNCDLFLSLYNLFQRGIKAFPRQLFGAVRNLSHYTLFHSRYSLDYGNSFCLFGAAGIKSRIQTAEYLPCCEAWCWISWIKSRFLTYVFSFIFRIFLILQVPQEFWFGESEMSCVMAFFSIFKLLRWILDVVTINRISFNHRRTWNPFGKSLEENYLWLVLPGFKTAKILILAVFHEFLWTESRTRKKTSLACYCWKAWGENQPDVLPAFWETEGMPYVSGAFGLSRAGNQQRLEQNQEMTYRNVLLVWFW